MYRFLIPFLVAFSLPAQTPSQTLDKPPQDVDDALRARIKVFYDYHVARKYRQAEQLIAEESKDDFYVLSKPEIQSYKIGNIEYSENFTKAKVIIVGAMPVLLPMAGGKIMDMPFASYWKVENVPNGDVAPAGKSKKAAVKKPPSKSANRIWVWYYNKDAARQTPFGQTKLPTETKPGEGPTALPARPTVSVEALQSALKIDRSKVELRPPNLRPSKLRIHFPVPQP